MWWAALIPVAMELMKSMSKQGGEGQGQGAPVQLPQIAPFNPSPMMTGDSQDTAKALRHMPNTSFDLPGGDDKTEMLARLLRGDQQFGGF